MCNESGHQTGFGNKFQPSMQLSLFLCQQGHPLNITWLITVQSVMAPAHEEGELLCERPCGDVPQKRRRLFGRLLVFVYAAYTLNSNNTIFLGERQTSSLLLKDESQFH